MKAVEEVKVRGRAPLTREFLNDLYWIRRLSTREIAKMVGTNHTTILKWMREYGIPRRKRERIVELRTDEDLAYVFGVLCGDGSFISGRSPHLRLKCADKDFAEAFARHATKVLGRSHRPIKSHYSPKEGQYIVTAYVPKSIVPFFERHPTKTHNWRVPSFVLKNDEMIAKFLRGFADSEGTVIPHGRIALYSSNRQGLEQVRAMLTKLGLVYGKVEISGDALNICAKRNFKIFHEKIGFSIRRQRERLLKSLEKYGRRRKWIEFHDLERTLYNLYWEKGLSTRQIARRIGVDGSSICRWMKKFGIPRRPPTSLKAVVEP